MNFYTKQHSFYCGIDLHAKQMFLCVMSQKGDVLLHRNMPNDSKLFLKLIKPFRSDIVVCSECVFCWYWLADLCHDNSIPFVLGHALYMKAIHGGKAKNDRIDSLKIARLLRSSMIPQAYVYPKKMRATRDLMRRRSHFVRFRADLLAHIQITNYQYNLPSFEKKVNSKGKRLNLVTHFPDTSVQKSMEANSAVLDQLDKTIRKIELFIESQVRYHDIYSYRLLRTVPGIGQVLAFSILYEIERIERFPRVQEFLSYSRLVKCAKESAGKRYGSSGSKIGNVHLKWAFSEAAVLFLKKNEPAKKWLLKKQQKHGKAKALTILAAKIGRCVYQMLKTQRRFDSMAFFNN